MIPPEVEDKAVCTCSHTRENHWDSGQCRFVNCGCTQFVEAGHAEDSYEGHVGATRRKMPDDRTGVTHAVKIGGLRGYITANPHEDGMLGEVFIHGFGQTGSTNQGWVDAFAVMVSIGLQFGAEFPMLARKFAHMRFSPNGDTDNPQIPRCQSIPDYIFRWLAQHYGSQDLQAELKRIDEEMAR